jgi:dipeptidyl aminopeptidase/acylaminoacyl peptidase
MEEKVVIKNSKGLNLCAVISYPDKNKQYPAVLILHGLIGYKEEAHLAELAKLLTKSGFVAIRFDASGSGESQGSFEEDYSSTNYLKDIKCVYGYIQKLDFVNKDRIGIFGHSMGGMLSIVFASQHPEIKTCIAVSPTTTLIAANAIQGIINEWQEIGYFFRKTSHGESAIRVPVSLIVDANKFDALDYIQKLTCPFLMVIGLIDEVVSPDDSRRIFHLANEPKELVEFKNIGHDYKKHPELIKKVNKKVLDFIKKYC